MNQVKKMIKESFIEQQKLGVPLVHFQCKLRYIYFFISNFKFKFFY